MGHTVFPVGKPASAKRKTTTKGEGTDWKRVDAMTDEDIKRAIATDPDSAPPYDLDDACVR